MADDATDFGAVADDLRRAANSFALLTSSATAFGTALNSFRSFQRDLTYANVVGGGTVTTYNQMSQAVRAFALATTASTSDSIAALTNLAQAGFTAKESLQALTGVLLLSSATLEDVAQASDLISSNIRAFNLETSDASRVANLFTASMNNSLATMDKLSYAFRQVGPVANAAGASIEETTALLDGLFNVGLRGEPAGTALRNLFIRLQNPTGAAAVELRKLNIATVDATGSFRGLEAIMRDLKNAGVSNGQLDTIFGNKALTGAIEVMNQVTQVASNGLTVYQNEINKISGTQAALETTIKNLTTFDAHMKIAANSAKDFALTVGELLAPYVQSIADFITDAVKAFRALDPETQRFYATMIAAAGAVLTFLGAISTFTFLFGGATSAVYGLGVALASLSARAAFAALTQLGLGITAIISGTTAAGLSLANLGRAMLAFVTGPITAILAGLAELEAAFIAEGVAASVAGFLTLGVAIAGVVAVLGGLYLAFGKSNDAAAKQLETINKLYDANKKLSENKAANAGLGTYGLSELASRTNVAEGLVSSDLLRAVESNDLDTAIQASQNGQRKAAELQVDLKKYQETLATTFKDALAFGAEQDKAFAEASSLDSGVSGFLRTGIATVTFGHVYGGTHGETTVLEAVKNNLKEEYSKLSADYATAQEIQKQITELTAREAIAIETGKQAEIANITSYVDQLASGDRELGPIFSDLTKSTKEFLQKADKATIDSIVNGLAEGDKAFTEDAFLEAVLKAEGVDPGFIAEVLRRRQKEASDKVAADLQSVIDGIGTENEKARIKSQEFVSKNSKSLGEALKAGMDAALSQSKLDLDKIFKDFGKDFGQQILDTVNNSQEVMDTILKDTTSANYKFDIPPTITDLLGGQGLIEAIRARTNENTTPEQFAQISKEEGERYQALLIQLLEDIKAATGDAISDDQLKQLEEIAKAQVLRIEQTLTDGIDQAAKSQDEARKRIDAAAKAAREAVAKAKRDAAQLVKDMREIADRLNEGRDAIEAARKKIFEETANVGVEQSIKLSLNFDTADINTQADEAILAIRRKIQDVQVDFKGSPDELKAIISQYNELISTLEAQRQADLANTNSFESQMQRRQKAIDNFIKDVTEAGIKSKDTFTNVGAGIASAFAEYQKNLVSLITITQDATAGLIDTLSKGISDFIFDTTNAWDNFKKSMLDISKQIFAGFTKALIQQGISSLTGGPGSILGNALQPSQYGSTGLPGVGSGGILGKLFPGLSGAFGGNNPGAANNPLGPVLTKVATDTDTLYQTNLVKINATLSTFQAGFASALQSIVSTISGSGIPGSGAVGGVVGGVGGAIGNGLSGFARIFTPFISAGQTALTAATSQGGYSPGSGAVSAESIVQGLVQRGLSPAVAAGFAGNFQQESSLNPNGPAGDNGTSIGLGQFHGDRMQALLDYAKSVGGDAKDANVQLDYVVKELQTSESRTADLLQGVTDPRQAADIIAKNYERPAAATANYGGRADYAQSALSAYSGGAPVPVTMVSTSGPLTPTANDRNGSGIAANILGGGTTGKPGAAGGANAGLQGQLEAFQKQFTAMLNQFGTGMATALNGVLQGIAAMASQMGKPITVPTVSFQGGGGATAGVGGASSLAGIGSSLLGLIPGFAEGGFAGLGGIFGSIGSGGGAGGGLLALLLGAAISGGKSGGGLGGIFASLIGGGKGAGNGSWLANLFGFDEGGFTGFGGKYEPAGLVHKGEYVLTAQATSRLPRELLDSLNYGHYANGGYVGGAPASGKVSLGDNVTLHATYHINGGDPDTFARSANQHAKQLARQLERAKRNT